MTTREQASSQIVIKARGKEWYYGSGELPTSSYSYENQERVFIESKYRELSSYSELVAEVQKELGIEGIVNKSDLDFATFFDKKLQDITQVLNSPNLEEKENKLKTEIIPYLMKLLVLSVVLLHSNAPATRLSYFKLKINGDPRQNTEVKINAKMIRMLASAVFVLKRLELPYNSGEDSPVVQEISSIITMLRKNYGSLSTISFSEGAEKARFGPEHF